MQGEGEPAQDGDVDFLTAGEEILHCGFERRSFRVAEFIRPLVLPCGIVLAADLETFFLVVAGAEALGFDVRFGRAQTDFFAPLLHVASVCLGRGPGELVFLRLRAREEGGGVREDFGEEGGGDGRVG